jgi:acyl-CoA reductase-like NAD-dependent aldehyde dehydrogenase
VNAAREEKGQGMTSTLELSDGTRVSAASHAFLTAGPVPHVIDGADVLSQAGAERDVLNPSTGGRVATATSGDATDVDIAVAAARRAFDDGRWRAMPPAARQARLLRLADLIDEHTSTLGELDTLDAGILRRWADYVAQYSVSSLRYFAGWTTKLAGALPPAGPDYVVQERIEPVGVVAVIKPWNGPAAIFAQAAPALAVGNSVIVKPAEHTPLSATLLGRLALEADIPPGVLNSIHGDGVVGAALVDHPGVHRLSFTGSVATGRRIAETAARSFKRANLELGGKSPVIVYDDADLDLAADAATRAVWNNSGQVCTAGSRTLVQRGIYDEFLARAVSLSQDLTVGNAFDDATDLGPLVTADQLKKVQEYVAIGRQEGAEVCYEGSVDPAAPGNYQAPVIFGGVRNDMTIAREEIFGPVMSVIPFDDEAEALRLANETEYGLAAGVFTRDIGRAQRAADALDVGTVWTNCYQVTDAAVSFGGAKNSGYGRSLGRPALDEYTRRKSVWSKTY